MSDGAAVHPPRSLVELFLGFFIIGARAFGGVLPWAHRVMVEEKRWVTEKDFAETVGLCQFLPGPNIGNASIVYGRRWFGLRGAITAFMGLFLFPYCWVLGLAFLYADYATHPTVRAVITGVGITCAGLFIGTAVKMGRPLLRNPYAVLLIVACFAVVAIGRISLLLVLPVALAIALAAAWRRML